MIIDCHGHYTTTPPELGQYRDVQRDALALDPLHVGEIGVISISDDAIRESIENNQLKLQRERGADLTIFSPRASWMGHHIGNEHTSRFWSQHCNDLIRRVCDLFPDNFVPVCQLPQSPGVAIDSSVKELERCVKEMGFIGCNVNPDPSGGFWTGPPLNDAYWWTLWEKMQELDVPGMGSRQRYLQRKLPRNELALSRRRHHCVRADDDVGPVHRLRRPTLRDSPWWRSGALPLGALQGNGTGHGASTARRVDPWQRLGSTHAFITSLESTCSFDVLPAENILFASEMVGAVRGVDPTTGFNYDDTEALHRRGISR